MNKTPLRLHAHGRQLDFHGNTSIYYITAVGQCQKGRGRSSLDISFEQETRGYSFSRNAEERLAAQEK
jgi:hypothetical protein